MMTTHDCSDSHAFSDPLHIGEESKKDESDLSIKMAEEIKIKFPTSNREENIIKEESIEEELKMILYLKEEFKGNQDDSQTFVESVKREDDDKLGYNIPGVVVDKDVTRAAERMIVPLSQQKSIPPNYSSIRPSPTIQEYSTDLKRVESLGLLGNRARRCPEKARKEFVKTDPTLPAGFKVREFVRGDGTKRDREYLNSEGTIIFRSRTAVWDYYNYKLETEEVSPSEPSVVVWLPEEARPAPSLVARSRRYVKPYYTFILPAGSTSTATNIGTHQKKNQQERVRRGALVKDLDKLRNMLPCPDIQLSMAAVLEVAIVHCVELQHQVNHLEAELKYEKERTRVLGDRLTQARGRDTAPNNNCSAKSIIKCAHKKTCVL